MEAIGIVLCSFERVVVTVTRPRRRHDDDTVNAGFIHHRQEALNRHRLRKLRLGAGHPGPIGDSAFQRWTWASAITRFAVCVPVWAEIRVSGSRLAPAPSVTLKRLRRDNMFSPPQRLLLSLLDRPRDSAADKYD